MISTLPLHAFLLFLFSGGTFVFGDSDHTKSASKNKNKLPNIVILFADNLGYDDISFFRTTTTTDKHGASTPNVDRIGREGRKFTNWNSAAALCSASRSALLTSKYPVRTGTYPRVFRTDATFGLLPEEVTLAELLKIEGYATSIVGKWHLGHRGPYLPTNQGFDSWVGIPYHMSGGSVDDHECNNDPSRTKWLPLFQNDSIVQQPVVLEELAQVYASASKSFIRENVANEKPFFLYMAFSHVHQLCAPRDFPEQGSCQWAAVENATFVDAVEEMDWITGQILGELDETGAANDTIVLFTSDNGPWVAEQACSGSKGPFKGEWFSKNANKSCTACPHDYTPDPTEDRPRRCVLAGTPFSLDGVPCGEDTGLGSLWEANLRMPAVIRYPGRIPPGTESSELVSTLDVLPTLLSMIGKRFPIDIDGLDVSEIILGNPPQCNYSTDISSERILFFWRDGFQDGPLPAPFGRFDVAAVKIGRIKAWFWTKSAHYNDDVEEFHDPPLLFDTISDPAESTPLDPEDYLSIIELVKDAVHKHKQSLDWTRPLTLDGDPANVPCVDRATACRTHDETTTLY